MIGRSPRVTLRVIGSICKSPTARGISAIDALGAAVQRVEAREQLAEGERLGQIVVAAAAQAANAVVDLRERAQDQNRRALAGFAQHFDDGEAVDVARQHPVHDDHVVGLARREEHAVAAVGGMIGGVAGLLQPLDHELADPLVVLDQQDLHVALSERRHGALGERGAAPPCGATRVLLRRRALAATG